jgi:hypothetical protein
MIESITPSTSNSNPTPAYDTRGGEGFPSGYFLLKAKGTDKALKTCCYEVKDGTPLQLWPVQHGSNESMAQVSYFS